MQIFTQPEALRAQCDAWRKENYSIALVPTMGYYHAGHESLMRAAKKMAKKVVVSLFVNPTQFGPGEDLDSYPRQPESDALIASNCGADALFTPEPAAMYTENHATWVEVPDMAQVLCGASRPLHFRGVCTIVLKLFMIVNPDVAVFGQKDWQQQAIIRRMARDFNLPVKIETIPIVREEDGLAMSSRNVYLDGEQRAQAPQIRQGLLLGKKLFDAGERNANAIRQAVLGRWSQTLTLGRLDYLSIVHPQTLRSLDMIEDAALMACAVRLGKARLIDNIVLAGA